MSAPIDPANHPDLVGVECTCEPDFCDAEGDPGCRYCQIADPYVPCPADEGVDDFDGQLGVTYFPRAEGEG